MVNLKKHWKKSLLTFILVELIMLGSVTAFSGGAWHFNIIGKRAFIFEILSSLKPIMENLVLLILAQKIIDGVNPKQLQHRWFQILFYSFGISLFSWGIFAVKFNIYDFFKSIFPIIFQTNKMATTVIVMLFIGYLLSRTNTLLLEFDKKIKYIILLALSIIPTILWSLKLSGKSNFFFGTVLWGVFLLLLARNLPQSMPKIINKNIIWGGVVTILVGSGLLYFLDLLNNKILLLNSTDVLANRLSFLTSNTVSFMIALCLFILLKNKHLIRSISWDLLFGAVLFSSHFLFAIPLWRNIWRTNFWLDQTSPRLLVSLLTSTIITSFILVALELLRKYSMKQLSLASPRKATALLSALGLALVANFALVNSNSLFILQDAFSAIKSSQLMLLNVLLFFALIMIIFAIFNRVLLTSMIILAFLVAFTFANVQKIISRNEPIIPVDITSNIQNMNAILKLVNIWLVVFLLILLLIMIILSLIIEKKLKFNSIFNWFSRFSIILVCSILIGIFLRELPSVPSSSVTWKKEDYTFFNKMMINELNYSYHPESIKTDFKLNGSAVALASRIIVPIMDKPANYSKQTINQIAEDLGKQADSINKTRDRNIKNDTVIYVLSESFSNPQRVPGVEMKNPIPETTQLKKQTTSGLMDSYGYGGGTADIEYEALTGLSLNNFAPTLSTPYVELIPKLSYQPSVLDIFKNKNAIHPFQPDLYNRVNVFKKLGFDKFYNTSAPNKVKYTKTIDGKNATGNRVSQNSKYISDKSAYKEVKRVMNMNKGGQFIQLSTMQNHMPYVAGQYGKGNPFAITGDLSDASQGRLRTYSYEINQTDKALKNLISIADNSKKDVTIVFYGDHLPGLYEWAQNNDQKMNQYDSMLHQTDYFIYSNHSNKKVQKSVAAPYMFTPMMLEQTNSKVSPYYALLTQCMKELPAGERNKYMLANGTEIYEKNLTNKQKKLLHEYRLIQYDITAGKHYLKKGSNFFTVK
ncbi:LTA synthase family protein [Pediococcus pentosaceus]|uniref:LTA synthase family protein n=1 Tax=Pediococcus pentosaceus TaxID=1255 RepID=UPI002FBDCB0A